MRESREELRERAEWIIEHSGEIIGGPRMVVDAADVIALLDELDRVQRLNEQMLGVEKIIVRSPRYNELGQRIMQDGPQA